MGVCFSVHNSGLPWLGGCGAHAYAMFISQFAFSEQCTDLHRTAAGEDLQTSSEDRQQLKNISKQ